MLNSKEVLGARDFVCGISFARAVVAHFGLPADTCADMSLNCGADEIFSLDVRLTLTADDLADIADLMEGRTPRAEPVVVTGDFDAWLRDRTERAHREFMQRTS